MKIFFAKLTVKKTERDFGVNISYFNENSLFLKLRYCQEILALKKDII